MSNHPEEQPYGILEKATLKSFFSIKENENDTLTYIPGF
jgi:hypothetical protein